MTDRSIVILMGPPGAGKGTQADILVKEHGFVHCSTGEMLRQEIQQGSELGKRVQSFVDEGRLVPDSVVAEIIQSRIEALKPNERILLDGFPRNRAQAEVLDGIVRSSSRGIATVLNIEIPKSTILERIQFRRSSSDKQRRDDDPNVIESRLTVHEEAAPDLESFYTQQGVLKRIDGDAQLETVTIRIAEALREEGIV